MLVCATGKGCPLSCKNRKLFMAVVSSSRTHIYCQLVLRHLNAASLAGTHNTITEQASQNQFIIPLPALAAAAGTPRAHCCC
jgi:hypothetical protein